MSKRRAEKVLDRDNWDQDDAPEEAGEFERASDEVIARRTIRKAKRTGLSTANNAPKASPFEGFSFFSNGGSSAPSSAATPTMTNSAVNSANGNRTSDEYLSKVAKLNRDILECITRLMDNGAYLNLTPCFEDYMKHFQRLTREEEDRQRKNNNGTAGPVFSAIPELSPAKLPADTSKQTFSFASPGSNKASTFGGNASSSLFNLDPSTKPANTENKGKPEFEFAKPMVPNKNSTFGVNSSPAKPDRRLDNSPEKNNSAPGFSFGKPSESTFSFGLSSPSTPKPSGDSDPLGSKPVPPNEPQKSLFGSSFPSVAANSPISSAQPFSFGLSSGTSSFQGFGTGSSAPAAGSSQTTTNDDEEDQPPKVDVAPVGDEGSLYTKKVKLYYKKEKADDKGAFGEKGVGFLQIFTLEGGAHQLLVRAQTALGNVLLNIRLDKSLPVSRMKNNNVAIICVPNPPLDPKSTDATPTMFLIRVKSKEDAAELYDKLVEFKGAA